MSKESPWLDTDIAAERLGVSPRYLCDRRREGDFKSGFHYRVKNPNARKPHYQWHLARIEKLWAAPEQPLDLRGEELAGHGKDPSRIQPRLF